MASKATTAKEYIDDLPEDRRKAIRKVRAAVNRALPKGYKEGMQYGMLGWFVPHSKYPAGYHCDPQQPVPFAGLASQKNYMSLYLMSVYTSAEGAERFHEAYRATGKKLDMGKSCVRFKTLDDLPLDLIAETISAIDVNAFIKVYEDSLR